MTLLLAVTIRCALGAATVAADAAPRGQRSRQSTAARGHSQAELNGLEDAHPPHRGHSAHGGEAAELHRTEGHAHHAAAGGVAGQEKHATAAHARGSPTSAAEGSKAPEAGGDASDASPGAEPEEDAEELDAEVEEPEHADAEDGADDFEGPVEFHLPQRGRVHVAVDAAGHAAEVRRGGGPVIRRHNHTSGTDLDDLEEEDSLVEEDADLRAQARRSGWWSRRRAPPRRRRAPTPVHCAWAAWGAWGTCSATCGEGKQSATRIVATAQLNGGRACTGETAKTQTCQIQKCTTTSTTTTTTTSTSTTTTTKKVVKAGASRPAGGIALALLLVLGAARPLL